VKSRASLAETTTPDTEAELRALVEAQKAEINRLTKVQRLYGAMVRNFPDGLIGVFDRSMKFIIIDGQDIESFDDTKSTNDVRQPGLLPETLTQLKRAFDGENVTCEIRMRDRIYNVIAAPLLEKSGPINEIICVMQNVTERRRMEEGLVKSLEREKELGELKSRFVTMASHEFRTPLTTILSSTFLLENYSGDDFAHQKGVHTNRIKRAVNNLTMILNEFLSLEKLEENKVRVIYQDINIPDYIQDLIYEMEVVKKDGQVVEYQHYGEESFARLDHQLLWSIATNLISNALKYSKVNDKILITSDIRHNAVVLIVKDNGIGIPEDERKHIFGRFYRARNAVNFEGTGLGLHITQKIVHLLQGSITFDSELDKGTTFTVSLPNGVVGEISRSFDD
jgi:signal transduction histidine kinase